MWYDNNNNITVTFQVGYVIIGVRRKIGIFYGHFVGQKKNISLLNIF